MDHTLGYLYCSDIPGFVDLIGISKPLKNVSSSSYAQNNWTRSLASAKSIHKFYFRWMNILLVLILSPFLNTESCYIILGMNRQVPPNNVDPHGTNPRSTVAIPGHPNTYFNDGLVNPFQHLFNSVTLFVFLYRTFVEHRGGLLANGRYEWVM